MIPAPAARALVAALAAASLALALPACTSSTTPTGSATSTPTPVTASASPTASTSPTTSVSPTRAPTTPEPPAPPKSRPPSPAEDPQALTIAITIRDGEVEPNGETLEAAAGQRVMLMVTSDIDDSIHAHTSGNGYELEVSAGETARGTFVAGDPGSYEIESHELEKTIVILNVR